jgi:pentatricopeptide repeat protein
MDRFPSLFFLSFYLSSFLPFRGTIETNDWQH